MAKMDKIGKKAEAPSESFDSKLDLTSPVFAKLSGPQKDFLRKNAENFTFIGGVLHANPAILKIAGYTPETGENSPGYERDRSRDLRFRTWVEKKIVKGVETEEECDNSDSKSRHNIESFKRDFRADGYSHGTVGVRIVTGDKVTPAIWVSRGRHRTVAAQEYNETLAEGEEKVWIPIQFVLGKISGEIEDFLENLHRMDLTPLARAQKLHAIRGSQENGEIFTIEKMSERFGISAENIKREIKVVEDVIPELQRVSSDGDKNVKGSTLSFTTHLAMIAGAMPASQSPENARGQREFLEKWMKGEIPDIHKYCLAIKRARKAAFDGGHAIANESGENPTGENRRRGRTESALYPKNGGLNATDIRYLATNGIPDDMTLDANGIRQFFLAVIGWDEFPDEIQAAIESFDFDGARKNKTAPKQKARVEGPSQKKVELPKELVNISSSDDLSKYLAERALAERANTKKEEVEETPSLGENLDFLKGFGEDSPSGDSFQ